MSQLTEKDRLLGQELSTALDGLADWRLSDDGLKLQRTLVFADFERAFAFMTEVAPVAEARNHHPEWCNIWSRVDISLTTHTAGGATRADVELARELNDIAGRFELVCDIGTDGECGGCC